MKLSAYILYIGILLSSCMAEQTNPLIIETCFDKVKNQNETDIDCGGKCKACEVVVPVVAPCKTSLVDNRVTYNGINYNLTSDNTGFRQVSNYYSNYFEIYIHSDDLDMTIEIYANELPKKDTVFPITQFYNPKQGYASVRVIQFYVFNSNSGDIYVTYKNNMWTIEFCTVKLSGESLTFSTSGRILYR